MRHLPPVRGGFIHPHEGTSERIRVENTLADLQRDVCRAGEALLENSRGQPYLLFRKTSIHLVLAASG